MDVISLYAHMFDEVSYLLRYPDTVDIYQFVDNMTDWHPLEKSYFIQSFLYYGQQLPDGDEGLLPPDPRISGVLSGECLCRPLRLMITNTVVPLAGLYHVTAKDMNLNEVIPGPNEETKRKLGKHGTGWHDYMMRGPAKYARVHAESGKCTGQGSNYRQGFGSSEDVLYGTGNNFNHTAGNTALLKYVFACIGIPNFRPEDCACNPERRPEVHVCYTYGTQADVYGDIKSGLCVSGRLARASAYDHVVVAYTSDDTDLDGIQVAAAGGVHAAVGCHSSPDWVNFGLNVGLLGLNAVKAIKSPKKLIDLALILLAGQKVGDLIKDFPAPVIKDKQCGTEIAYSPNLVDGCIILPLDINRTTVALLQSNFNVHVHVKGKFEARSSVKSSYGLTGVMHRFDPDIVGDVCCGTGAATYSLAGYSNFLNETALRSWTAGNFWAQGVDIFDDIHPLAGELGIRGGGVRPDCKLEILHNPGKPVSMVIAPELTANGLFLEQHGQRLHFGTKEDGVRWQLDILDLNGRSVDQLQGLFSGPLAYNLSGLTLPAGIYVGRLSTQTASKTIKIVKAH